MTQGWLCSFPFANKAKTRRKIVQKKKKMKLWGGEGWWSKTSLYMVCCVSMCTPCCTALSVHQPSTYMYTHTSTARTKTHASHRTHSSHTVFSSPTWLHYPSPVPLAHHITYSPPNNHFIQPLDIITPKNLCALSALSISLLGEKGFYTYTAMVKLSFADHQKGDVWPCWCDKIWSIGNTASQPTQSLKAQIEIVYSLTEGLPTCSYMHSPFMAIIFRRNKINHAEHYIERPRKLKYD